MKKIIELTQEEKDLAAKEVAKIAEKAEKKAERLYKDCLEAMDDLPKDVQEAFAIAYTNKGKSIPLGLIAVALSASAKGGLSKADLDAAVKELASTEDLKTQAGTIEGKIEDASSALNLSIGEELKEIKAKLKAICVLDKELSETKVNTKAKEYNK